MASFIESAKPILGYGWKSLKIAFICFRCLLWSGIFFVLLFSDDYFRKDHLDLLWLFLVLVSIPITMVLIWKQFVSDIKLLRYKYSKYLFDLTYNELTQSNDNFVMQLGDYSSTDRSNEIFWNKSTGEEFADMYSYLNEFMYRRDSHAQKMKNALSKNNMKSLIMSSRNTVHSIRIWNSEGLVSFDFGDPITASSIEGFSISKDERVIRGEAITTRITNYKGFSYPSLIKGFRNYRGKSKTSYHTTYLPDRVISEYTVNVLIAQPNYEVIRMSINDNNSVVHEITNEFRILGIKQINNVYV